MSRGNLLVSFAARRQMTERENVAKRGVDSRVTGTIRRWSHTRMKTKESKKLSCTVIANIFMLSTVCPYRVVITSRMSMQIPISIYNYRYAC